MVAKLDPVAQRLSEATGDQSANLVQWLDGKRTRAAMARRAFWYMMAAWLLVTAAAMIATFVSWSFTRSADALFGSNGIFVSPELPGLVAVVPFAFGALSVVLLVGGIVTWAIGRIPGLNMTVAALDWAGSSDAVARLLSVGCTYPEAFKVAASASTSYASRRWLMRSAVRVEQGWPIVGTPSRGDAAMVELFVDSHDQDPVSTWRLTADHFAEVARRRIALLIGSAPVLSTLLAGLIVWISVASTLGFMWRSTITSLQAF